ncbi:molecular chaperone TorD family protein [Rhizobiales bacterium]|uniref:TorD/DmsD family molecular chaperone n=1 Tax=Hongsoonwoonella zoysiae TaxID=2821844 RepID=UPI001560C2C1|nr:molecular chaperone TorD family protein [Hongsoonwoonella zoysiae]NRG18355.1 molecular chaperone TorD family protein [Hongsoonwoonella zoysiae]
MALENAVLQGVSEEELERAGLYNLLGSSLQQPVSPVWLSEAGALRGGEGTIGACLKELADAARGVDHAEVSREYHDLFIGVGRGELVPYGSYYLTGFLHEKPLADLRRDMAELGIERDPSVKEPEDHIASVCQMMAGLIGGAFGAPRDLKGQRQFFSVHLGNWAPHFFKDLENAKTSRFYRHIGKLGRTFMEVETRGFEMVE